jgi:hypothetical protein
MPAQPRVHHQRAGWHQRAPHQPPGRNESLCCLPLRAEAARSKNAVAMEWPEFISAMKKYSDLDRLYPNLQMREFVLRSVTACDHRVLIQP